MHALSSLNKEVVARGWTRKATSRILLELATDLALALGGIVVVVLFENMLVKAAGMLVSTAGSLGVSTNTHTSSHYATCDRHWINRALTYFGYPFFFGASAAYWWNKHVVVHHPTPNVIGFDDDADLMPFFAINENEKAGTRGLQRLWFEIQWIFIVAAIGLNCFNVQFTSWRYLARQLRNPTARKPAHWIDLAVLVSHFAVWLLLPSVVFGWTSALAFYLARTALMGYALFVAFAPAHFPAEAAFLTKEIENKREYSRRSDFILLQTVTTVNFRTGPIGRLLCAGVEYQIEHHLFPGVSHVYYPQLSAIVKRFCEENGYPYRTLGWWEAIVKSLVVFRTPKRVEPSLEAMRRRAWVSREEPASEGVDVRAPTPADLTGRTTAAGDAA